MPTNTQEQAHQYMFATIRVHPKCFVFFVCLILYSISFICTSFTLPFRAFALLFARQQYRCFLLVLSPTVPFHFHAIELCFGSPSQNCRIIKRDTHVMMQRHKNAMQYQANRLKKRYIEQNAAHLFKSSDAYSLFVFTFKQTCTQNTMHIVYTHTHVNSTKSFAFVWLRHIIHNNQYN